MITTLSNGGYAICDESFRILSEPSVIQLKNRPEPVLDFGNPEERRHVLDGVEGTLFVDSSVSDGVEVVRETFVGDGSRHVALRFLIRNAGAGDLYLQTVKPLVVQGQKNLLVNGKGADSWRIFRAPIQKSDIPGVPIGDVLVIGGGTAGLNAARVAAGIGANVTLLEVDLDKMHFIDTSTHGAIRTIYSTEAALLERLSSVDLLIGAVLIPGAKAPKLIKREFLKQMKPGSVFVDIAIDQGGCAETSRATTHDDPVYWEEDVLHYCVANMPGAYARTSTQALTNSTLPYAVKLANLGLEGALGQIPELRPGVNTLKGYVTCRPVAEALGMEYKALDQA